MGIQVCASPAFWYVTALSCILVCYSIVVGLWSQQEVLNMGNAPAAVVSAADVSPAACCGCRPIPGSMSCVSRCKSLLQAAGTSELPFHGRDLHSWPLCVRVLAGGEGDVPRTSRAQSLRKVAEAEAAADRELDHLMTDLSDWSAAEQAGLLRG
jgi:hypothetical protein